MKLKHKAKKIDEESLFETIEVLSDPFLLKNIEKGIEDIRKGKCVELK